MEKRLLGKIVLLNFVNSDLLYHFKYGISVQITVHVA